MNGLIQNKKTTKRKSVFYFLIKVPNLDLYWNQNGKSIFPNCIDCFGRKKRETKVQQTKKEKAWDKKEKWE